MWLVQCIREVLSRACGCRATAATVNAGRLKEGGQGKKNFKFLPTILPFHYLSWPNLPRRSGQHLNQMKSAHCLFHSTACVNDIIVPTT